MKQIDWLDIKRGQNKCITCAYLFSNAQSKADMINLYARNDIVSTKEHLHGRIGVRELNCYKELNDKMFYSFRHDKEVQKIREEISKAKCPFTIIPPFRSWQPHQEGVHPQIILQQEQTKILIRLTGVLAFLTIMLIFTSIALIFYL